MPDCDRSMPAESDIAAVNKSFYNRLWSQSRLSDPADFNTWPFLSDLLPQAPARLEIGPGLRPRLPLDGTHFLDLSQAVVDQLSCHGAYAQLGDAARLPFDDGHLDLVCVFDVIEHVEDDLRTFAELSRVLKKGGLLVISLPLHTSLWTSFDRFVGHVRRYEPDDLVDILHHYGLKVEQSALFGMQPSSSWLLDLGMWLLTHQQRPALFCYNYLFLPLRLLFQKRLRFSPGLMDMSSVPEILLVCRRSESR